MAHCWEQNGNFEPYRGQKCVFPFHYQFRRAAMPLPDADLFHGECNRLGQGQTNPFIERLTFSCEKNSWYIWTWFQSGSSPHFRGVKVGIHPERHVLKQVQRSVIRVWWLSPLPTHSTQISVATTLIRVGWATNLQKKIQAKCDKTFNGLIPKRLSLVQGVWRDPFKRSCFKIIGILIQKQMSEARRCLSGQGRRWCQPATQTERKSKKLDTSKCSSPHLVCGYSFPSELRCLASAAAWHLHPFSPY